MGELDHVRPVPIDAYADDRGVLYKVLRRTDPLLPRLFGELYVLATGKGEIRGNHYHRETTEWFVVVKGRMACRLASLESADRTEFILDARNPCLLRVPPGVPHRLTGLSAEPAVLLAYADREYDEEAPDAMPFDFSEVP